MDITVKTTSEVTYRNIDNYILSEINAWKEDIQYDEDFNSKDPEKVKGYIEDLEERFYWLIEEVLDYHGCGEEKSKSNIEEVYKEIETHFKKEIDDALNDINN